MKCNRMIPALLGALALTACNSADTVNAQQPESLSQLLQRRYSGYKFDSTRPVSEEQLQIIMSAGQSAPSSYNDQPWRFIVCNKTTNLDAYEKALNTLVPSNQKWAEQVPVLIVVVAATNSSRGNTFNRWAQYDTGAAAFSMMLQATSLGLMAHQMGGFDETKMKEVFGISEDYVPMAVMAIGYPASEDKQPERKRKPIEQIFFDGNWVNPK